MDEATRKALEGCEAEARTVEELEAMIRGTLHERWAVDTRLRNLGWVLRGGEGGGGRDLDGWDHRLYSRPLPEAPR